MKFDPSLLSTVQNHEVRTGNIYPAQGGRKCPGTSYWLVVALTPNGAACVGFNEEGEACSTATYLKSALHSRPLLGRADLSSMKLEVCDG